jgi:hypothetical protein
MPDVEFEGVAALCARHHGAAQCRPRRHEQLRGAPPGSPFTRDRRSGCNVLTVLGTAQSFSERRHILRLAEMDLAENLRVVLRLPSHSRNESEIFRMALSISDWLQVLERTILRLTRPF